MKSHLGKKYFLKRIGMVFLISVLLSACIPAPETPQYPTAKPTLKPTVKPTITKSSSAPSTPKSDEPPTKTFSIRDANKIAPDDVLKEVSFGGRGGGGICEKGDFSYPAIDEESSSRPNAEWLAPIYITVCGWWSDSEVSVLVELPDGSVLTDQADVDKTSSKPSIFYPYHPNANSPTGRYKFSFRGNSGEVQYSVNVSIPNASRMYYIENVQSLYLYGFFPKERVRLLLYSTPTGTGYTRLTAWSEYYVDNSGKLLIKINPDDAYYGNYIAVGEKSGSVGNRQDVLTSPSSTSGCPNALPSRLEVGKYAYVATNPPLDQRIREGPGTNYSIIGYIDTGHAMKILDGPRCADGWAWWKVQSILKPDLIGWTAEGDDVYWLIPCNSLGSCP